jgi:hypothetical protein
VHFLGVSEILSGGERKTRSNNTLDSGIIGEVHEKNDTVHGTVYLEVSLEEEGSLFGDSHSSEYNGEVFVRVIMHIFVLNE